MKMYSAIHILLIIPVPFIFISGRFFKKKYRPALFHISLLLFVSEMAKQYICCRNGIGSIWYFPFQLCSTPMYYFLFCRTKNESVLDAYENYLSSFILLGAVMAILYPEDMINRPLPWMIYSFLWHYILIYMASLVFYHKKSGMNFAGSAIVFLLHAAVATLINVVLHNLGELNMFYISPYIDNTQPIFNRLSQNIGIIPANTLYVLSIITASFILYRIENRIRK